MLQWYVVSKVEVRETKKRVSKQCILTVATNSLYSLYKESQLKLGSLYLSANASVKVKKVTITTDCVTYRPILNQHITTS